MLSRALLHRGSFLVRPSLGRRVGRGGALGGLLRVGHGRFPPLCVLMWIDPHAREPPRRRLLRNCSIVIRADQRWVLSPPRSRRKRSMSAIRSSPSGQALLVGHRLEALDVRPRRLLDRRGRVQAVAQLVCLVGELARRQVDPEVVPERLEQGQRRGRVRARDVVRDLREVAERRASPPWRPRTRASRRTPTGRAGCRPGRRRRRT